ncbi:hypothetical protein GCM10025780_01840 [Frondihabitans cladoniiphilus]|uniref:Uncharacterized protein n=1 Tax=Frondihabitans cladoniiphilus TaxID=715785 RepID=A0ABP8VIM6_9MICO
MVAENAEYEAAETMTPEAIRAAGMAIQAAILAVNGVTKGMTVLPRGADPGDRTVALQVMHDALVRRARRGGASEAPDRLVLSKLRAAETGHKRADVPSSEVVAFGLWTFA